MVKTLTLCVVRNDTHVLLGMKKRGFGEGRWNGFGGKVQLGETIEEAARRELREECGLEAEAMEKRGVLMFEFATQAEMLEVHVFEVTAHRGEPVESDEMRPAWFRLTDIPFDQMWPDDRHWFPHLLDGKNVNGKFYFLDTETLLDFTLHEELPQPV